MCNLQPGGWLLVLAETLALHETSGKQRAHPAPVLHIHDHTLHRVRHLCPLDDCQCTILEERWVLHQGHVVVHSFRLHSIHHMLLVPHPIVRWEFISELVGFDLWSWRASQPPRILSFMLLSLSLRTIKLQVELDPALATEEDGPQSRTEEWTEEDTQHEC